MLKNWRFWLGLLISLAFLYWIGAQVRDMGRLLESLRQAQYWYIVPALLAYFIGVYVRAIRWHYLLSP
ncbi:MAG: lysylphosphatidylglycerol synthase domain-containing protein, partial [Chloroflexota bacterium]